MTNASDGPVDPNTGMPTSARASDHDGDGIDDVDDDDDDNDGLPDVADRRPLDTDNDGVDNALDSEAAASLYRKRSARRRAR